MSMKFKGGDLKRLTNYTGEIKKQMAYATSLAINETAKDIKKGVERQLNRDIDRPTPFTQKAFYISYSNKRKLKATIGIKPIQAKYLGKQIEGGKGDKPFSLIPKQKVRNKYGNLPRNKLSKLNAQGKTFKANGVIKQRLKKSVKDLAFVGKQATYKKRFKFFERGKKTFDSTYQLNMQSAIRKAIATAR